MLEALHDIHTILVFHFIFFFVIPIKITKKETIVIVSFSLYLLKLQKKETIVIVSFLLIATHIHTNNVRYEFFLQYLPDHSLNDMSHLSIVDLFR